MSDFKYIKDAPSDHDDTVVIGYAEYGDGADGNDVRVTRGWYLAESADRYAGHVLDALNKAGIKEKSVRVKTDKWKKSGDFYTSTTVSVVVETKDGQTIIVWFPLNAKNYRMYSGSGDTTRESAFYYDGPYGSRVRYLEYAGWAWPLKNIWVTVKVGKETVFKEKLSWGQGALGPAVKKALEASDSPQEASSQDQKHALDALERVFGVRNPKVVFERMMVGLEGDRQSQYHYFAIVEADGVYYGGNAYGEIGGRPKAVQVASGEKADVEKAVNKKIRDKEKKYARSLARLARRQAMIARLVESYYTGDDPPGWTDGTDWEYFSLDEKIDALLEEIPDLKKWIPDFLSKFRRALAKIVPIQKMENWPGEGASFDFKDSQGVGRYVSIEWPFDPRDVRWDEDLLETLENGTSLYLTVDSMSSSGRRFFEGYFEIEKYPSESRMVAFIMKTIEPVLRDVIENGDKAGPLKKVKIK